MEYMIQIADQIRELQEDADKKMEIMLKEIALIHAKLHELDGKKEYNSNMDKYTKRK